MPVSPSASWHCANVRSSQSELVVVSPGPDDAVPSQRLPHLTADYPVPDDAVPSDRLPHLTGVSSKTKVCTFVFIVKISQN